MAISPNGNPTEGQTAPQRWKPPPGIYYEFNRQRPTAPFLLRWDQNGTPRTQSFANETDRETAAKALAEKRAEFGKEVLTFDPREWRRWLEFKERAGGEDPLDILREVHANRAARGLPSSVATRTVPLAVAAYLEHRISEGLSKDTIRHFKKHLSERFAATHAALKLHEVTAEVIRRWLGSLKHPRTGAPLDALTKRHHRKDLNTFLDYCVLEGWLARNPCSAVAVPKVEEEDVILMSIEEGRRLFAANAAFPVVGRLALEAFGFLRASSAGRIGRSHIQFQERGIRMPGHEHKSRKAKFRQGHPDNLWAWLGRAPDECWEMTAIQYRNEKGLAFARAGLSGSDNRLRKTCLSAHLAWLKNQPLTSYLAQHRHMTTTDNYLGVMTEQDGKAWFEIGPPFTP